MPYNATIMALDLPARIRSLPVSDKGWPIPWFVGPGADGKPDFRIIKARALPLAWKHKSCWICGQQLGVFKAMVIGPMCSVNRVVSEPPSHRECAEFAAIACPFLTNPKMRRREGDMPEQFVEAPGLHIEHNPGATAVWVTKDVRPMNVSNGTLFKFGKPESVTWFANGRRATRAEVQAAIDKGLPALLRLAVLEGEAATAEFHTLVLQAERTLPIA